MAQIRVRAGLWREEVLARAGRIADECQTLGTDQLPGVDHAFVEAGITRRVHRASALARDRLSPVEWWSGSQVGSAWRELRLAEECLVRATADPVALRSKALAALEHATGRLDDSDARVTALRHELENADADPGALRALTLDVLVAAHEISDQQHRTLCAFRIQLRVISGILLGLALGVVVVALRATELSATLVPAPAGFTPKDAVLMAMACGAVGALFSAVPSLAQIPDHATSFNPIGEQAVLKIVVGSWSALVGLVAAAAGLGGVQDGVTSLAGFVMMCAMFGVTQEALTRFADHKASEVTPTA